MLGPSSKEKHQEQAKLACAINTSEQSSVNTVTSDGVFQSVGTSDV